MAIGAIAMLIALLIGSASAEPARPKVSERSGLSAWRSDPDTGPLQARVDALHPGDVLEISGLEHGPIVIRTPDVTIVGGKDGTIDGQGRDTVVVIKANGVKLRNVTLQGSGHFNPRVDAGVAVVSANHIVLEELRLRDVLFGIDVSDAKDIVIRGCTITSKDFEKNDRGDAIRIWSSSDVIVEENEWHDVRDAVAWYSKRITFKNNRAYRTRYSIHSMYSESLFIEGNVFENNSVGVFIMYGQGTTVLNNTVRYSSGVTGIGLGLKETSSVYARDNSFIYCATGILVDNSPWEPGTRNWILDNTIQFNDVGVLLANDRQNEFRRNVFDSNRLHVDSEQRRKSPGTWRGNYWSDYEGFDRDGDEIGDTPHVPRKYGDLLTGAHPSAKFFTGTPVLAVVSLIERLVPLTEPIELLEDPEPRRVSRNRRSDQEGSSE